ncbi:restriction endonuclease subunit S [Pseudomonas aeruginosa]
MSETALSAIAEINPGARIPKEITGSDEVSFIPMSDVSESGDWTTRQTRPLRSVTAGFTAFEESDVLVAKITPCLENGKGAHARGLCNGIGFGSTEFHVLRARQGVDPRFVFHITQSRRFRQAAERQMVGSAGQQRVQRQFFDEFLVRDFPQGEQRVIAQVLDTLDTTIRETEALIDKLKAVKQGLLHDLLTRGIDVNGQLRPPQSEAPQLYKDSPLGWIPREWEAGKVTNYLDPEQGIKPGPFGSSIKKESYAETGFKVYGQEQVISGDQDFGDYFVPLRKYQELQDFSVKSGDVLISLVGTIGKVLVLKAPLQAGLINPRLMRLRPDQRIADSEFVGFLVASDYFASQVFANAGGGTMPVINKRIISGIHAPVVPLTEQIAILKVKAAIDRRIDSELLALAKLREQKSGLMDDLLTGRVRVTPLLESVQQAAAQTGA